MIPAPPARKLGWEPLPTMNRPDFSIHHVARLARLDLDPAEAEVLQAQLDKVLAHIDQLREFDLGMVAGDDPPSADHDPLRDDRPRPGLDRETALASAPAQARGQCVVPRMIDSE